MNVYDLEDVSSTFLFIYFLYWDSFLGNWKLYKKLIDVKSFKAFVARNKIYEHKIHHIAFAPLTMLIYLDN